MKRTDISFMVTTLRGLVPQWQTPAVTVVARTRDPFRVLMSTILSLRTQDQTTARASERLFALGDTPADLVRRTPKQIERAIYPVGFYRTKAKVILGVCRDLIERYRSQVPADIDELLTLKGVGRKTANLVVTLGHGLPGICVDTHVHRICNRWGMVTTRTPDQTEARLRTILPAEYWIEFNDLLVTFGQNLCTPLSPWCSRCALAGRCARRGVARSR